MNSRHSLGPVRFILLALAVAFVLGCEPEQRWKLEYVEVQAVPLGPPFAPEDNLERPFENKSRKWSLSVRKTDPNVQVAPSQTIALVRSLGSNGGPGDDCTGVFVSKRDFLTAGHCAPKTITIDLGPGPDVEGKCTRFPDPEKWEDWAICSFKDNVARGELPLTRCAPEPNALAVIMGFCKTGSLGAGVVQILTPEGGFIPVKRVAISGCSIDSGGSAFIPEKLEERDGNLFVSSGEAQVFGIVSTLGKCPPGEPMRTCLAPTRDDNFLKFIDNHRTGTITVLECS